MKIRHVVDPETEDWYHLDEKFNVFNCACLKPVEDRAELCLSQCVHLQADGELRRVKREIAAKRKELGMLKSNSEENSPSEEA